MINETFLVVDTETGGINPNINPLLSIGFVVYNIQKGILGELELFIKHPFYKINPVAAKINGFKREKHDLKAIIPEQAINLMESFLSSMFFLPKDIVIVGHNVQFDANFLKVFLRRNKHKFENYFSYRMIDTNSILKYLSICNILPEISGGLSGAAEYFNIYIKNRHSALDDARATAILFGKLINLINK